MDQSTYQMEVLQQPETMVAKQDRSPTHSTSLSSPFSRHSPKDSSSIHLSNPRWTKAFKLVHKYQDHSICQDTFVAKSRTGTRYKPLVAINSTVGNGECLAQTAKQWNTIIEKAKADDRVSDAMKAAKFFHFGHVVRDPKPAHPSEAYVLIRLTSESEFVEEIKGLPLPLQAFAADRRKKIRQHRRLGPIAALGPDLSETQSTISESTRTLSNELITNLTEAHGLENESVMKAPNLSSIRKFKSGHDLNYLKFDAEEHMNDSELIKGVGRVPINQKIPEPIKPVENKPWELPPDAWALRNLNFLLQKMISSDLNINNLTILSSVTNLASLDDPEALQLKWMGKTEQTINVFKGRLIKCVPFEHIIMIKYNRKESKVLFQFWSENSDKPEELLLILLPITNTDWQSLQTCCYSLIKGKPSRQRCDVEGQDFFDDKTKALMNLRVKLEPMASFLNRSVPKIANRGTNLKNKPRKITRPIFRTRPIANPILKAPPAIPVETSGPGYEQSPKIVCKTDSPPDALTPKSPDLLTTSENQQVLTDDGINPGQVQISPEDETGEEELAIVINDPVVEIEVKDKVVPDVDLEAEDETPAGLYYRSMLRSGIPIPVHLNDIVVRLRSEKERETGGKRDKLDLFDGPWRIVEFDQPQNIHGVKVSTKTNKGNGNESPSHFQFDKYEAKMMLKTKVQLGFPREAHVVRWVELNRLLPVTRLENVRNGKLHASCWGVAELTEFKALQSEMANRNLEAFDPKYQIANVDTPLNPSGGTDQDPDEGIDEDEAELSMHVVELKSDIFVAVLEADSKAVDGGDNYLVEKLRSKRLRLFKLNSPTVRKHKLKTDGDDPWVKILLKEMPQLAVNRIVVSEYKVHWAGWPDEDDTWDIGVGNIAKGFIDEYHKFTDLLRDISIDTLVVNPKDMVFKDDLPKSGKGRQSGGTRKSTGSLALIHRESTSSLAANNMASNSTLRETQDFNADMKKLDHRASQLSQKDQEEEFLDEGDDIAMAKVIQASLDEAKIEKTKAELRDLQKAMGVDFKKPASLEAPDADTSVEDDGFMQLDEVDEDEESDAIMAEVDEHENNG